MERAMLFDEATVTTTEQAVEAAAQKALPSGSRHFSLPFSPLSKWKFMHEMKKKHATEELFVELVLVLHFLGYLCRLRAPCHAR
jgi:hypothetical protein